MEHLPSSLNQVARGLRLVHLALMLTIVAVIATFFLSLWVIGGAILGMARGGLGNPQGQLIFFFVVSLGFMAIAVLDIVGRHYCLAAPPETRARGLILSSILLAAIPFVVSAAGQFMQLPPWAFYARFPA